MRRVLTLVAVGILFFGVAGVFSVAQTGIRAGQEEVTAGLPIGDFLVRYAQATGLAGDSATPEQAFANLQAAGLISGDWSLEGALTEGDVVRISESMQLGIATESPDQKLSSDKVDTFFQVYGSALAMNSPAYGEFGSLLEGKTKKKKAKVSPTHP